MSSFRQVEVKTWPERSDVLVVDFERSWVIAHYAHDDVKFLDADSNYQARVKQAILALEQDQEYLSAFYGIDDLIRLKASGKNRSLIESVLNLHGMTLDMVAFDQMDEVAAFIKNMSVEQQYHLMLDWHDMIERHVPRGTTLQDKSSWAHRASPASAFHFHYLALGLETNQATEIEQKEAHSLFKTLIDVPIENVTLGHLIRWVYFHSTEFQDQEPFTMRAFK